MATENRIAYIQWIIEAIRILCDKSPIQNCLSERTLDRIRIRAISLFHGGNYRAKAMVKPEIRNRELYADRQAGIQ